MDFPGLWGPLCYGNSLWRIIDKGFGKAGGSQATCAMETQPGQFRPKQSFGPIPSSSSLHLHVGDLETHTGLKQSHSATRARKCHSHSLLLGLISSSLALPLEKNFHIFETVKHYFFFFTIERMHVHCRQLRNHWYMHWVIQKEIYITLFNLITWQWSLVNGK